MRCNDSYAVPMYECATRIRRMHRMCKKSLFFFFVFKIQALGVQSGSRDGTGGRGLRGRHGLHRFGHQMLSVATCNSQSVRTDTGGSIYLRDMKVHISPLILNFEHLCCEMTLSVCMWQWFVQASQRHFSFLAQCIPPLCAPAPLFTGR